MSDAAASFSSFPADLHAAYPQGDLLWSVLEASLAGIALYAPLRDAEGHLVDFAIDLLNPAAQCILSQPAWPGGTFLGHYPHAMAGGGFAFQREVFESGKPGTLVVAYQADGLDTVFQLAARRVGQRLLVSFTEANQELHAAALDVAQARTEASLQRQQLYNVLQQAPAMICIFDGPQHTFQFVNPPYQALVGDRPLVGKPIAEAMPELVGQPVFGLLDQVYQSGETFRASEMLVQLDHQNEGLQSLEKRYYNFIYQARRDLAGVVDGILVFAYDVTTQVLARQQVQHLNEELAATNDELHASNTEFLTSNAELARTQLLLQQLNYELEDRVQSRTYEAGAARAETERQRQQFEQLMRRAPAAICIFDGPDYVYEFVNSSYQRLFSGRRLLGLPLVEALPEMADQPLLDIMYHVYTTGQTFEGQEVLLPLARTAGGPLEDVYFDLTYQARYNGQGAIDGLVTYAYDVTAQVLARRQVQHLNEELAATNEELQTSNEELSDTNTQLGRTNVDLDNFIYTASHDLKAPIANIEGLLLALQQELPAAGRVGQVPTMLHLMQAAIERFGRTIAHLTEVSSLQKAHEQPATQVSLARVVEEVLLDLAPLIIRTNARVLVEVPEGTILLFSEKNLRSVVYNLLSNALKYHHPDRAPVVQVAYRAQGHYQVLEVQDNGLGMDLVRGQAKLFAMFQRLHTHVEGTGIGLYMVKKMVENAGGRIEVQSQPEQGTIFTVYLPR